MTDLARVEPGAAPIANRAIQDKYRTVANHPEACTLSGVA
jgi:hypothetical protein